MTKNYARLRAAFAVSMAMISVGLPAKAQQQIVDDIGTQGVRGEYYSRPLRGSRTLIQAGVVRSSNMQGCVNGAVIFMEEAPRNVVEVRCVDRDKGVVTIIKAARRPREDVRIINSTRASPPVP